MLCNKSYSCMTWLTGPGLVSIVTPSTFKCGVSGLSFNLSLLVTNFLHLELLKFYFFLKWYNIDSIQLASTGGNCFHEKTFLVSNCWSLYRLWKQNSRKKFKMRSRCPKIPHLSTNHKTVFEFGPVLWILL